MKQLSEQAGEPGAPAAAKATQTKLVKDFQAVLKEFQKAQRTCAERETNFLPQAKRMETRQETRRGHPPIVFKL